MKKVIMLVALCLIASLGYAQKSNINKAKNKAGNVENPDIPGAIEAINAALVDPSTKGLAETLFTAGYVYEQKAEADRANAKKAGTQPDAIVIGESAAKAYEYYIQAYELDQQPNAKGKIAPKFTNRIKESVLRFYNNYYFVNLGANYYNSQRYAEAIKAFDTQLDIINLPFIAGTKECPTVDSIYHQVQYFSAICTQLSGDTKGAIAKYENIKDNGYENDRIHQFLYNLYVSEKDTTNFLRILEQGKQRFPDNFFYLGTLINYYMSNNQRQKASDALEEAIQRDPTNAKYYSTKGDLLMEVKQTTEALKYFDKAIEMAPESSDAWYNKGRAIYNIAVDMDTKTAYISNQKMYDEEKKKVNAKFKEALTYLEKARELDGQNEEALRLLKTLYFRFSATDKNFEKKYNEIERYMQSMM
ncbi:MAG: tetratricopeptide repeat protein [Bacteroidales bacterium]|nr:tetratricopeptide repeat protein [Bacteroidales bacterium]